MLEPIHIALLVVVSALMTAAAAVARGDRTLRRAAAGMIVALGAVLVLTLLGASGMPLLYSQLPREAFWSVLLYMVAGAGLGLVLLEWFERNRKRRGKVEFTEFHVARSP